MRFLFDCHAHTSCLSYCCASGITPETYRRALALRHELDGIAITNHGFATYFPAELAWSAAYMKTPRLFDEYRAFGNRRLEAHLEQVELLRGQGLYTGFEVEMMEDGRLTLDEKFRHRIDVLIGSVHFFPDFEGKLLPETEILPVWWAHTEKLMGTGIDILGHPFRWLRRTAKVGVTDDMIRRLVALARKNGVALEINSHMRIGGDVEMIRECVKAGVPLALGTDSHCEEEIGNLEYPLSMVEAAGFRLEEIPLWLPKKFKVREKT